MFMATYRGHVFVLLTGVIAVLPLNAEPSEYCEHESCEGGDRVVGVTGSNGYLVYRPNMGRFGNQVDHLLGALGLAQAVKRTLVVPPIVAYDGGSAMQLQPFDEIFSVDALRGSGVDIVTAEEFAGIHKDKSQTVYCFSSCDISYLSPHSLASSYWSHYDVKIDNTHIIEFEFGVTVDMMIQKLRYPEHDVILFDTAPFSYPAESRHNHFQQFIQWMQPLDHEVIGEDYVAIHLRGGTDWVSACRRRLDDQDTTELMSSPQCGLTRHANISVPYDVCVPNVTVMATMVLRVCREANLNVIHIGTDCKWCQQQLMDTLEHMAPGTIQQLQLQLSPPVTLTLFTDLQLFVKARHFIGNCVSSFSAFAARARVVKSGTGTGTHWWGPQDVLVAAQKTKDIEAAPNLAFDEFEEIFLDELSSQADPCQVLQSDVHVFVGDIVYIYGEIHFANACDIPPSSHSHGFEVRGNVLFNDCDLVSIKLFDSMHVVTGDVQIQGGSIEALEFLLLVGVGGSIIIRDVPLVSLQLRFLEHINGSLVIQSTALTTLTAMPRLTMVLVNLMIADNTALTTVTVESLTRVGGGVHILNNQALLQLSMPTLQSVGRWMEIYRSHLLEVLALDALVRVAGVLHIAHATKLIANQFFNDETKVFNVSGLNDGGPAFPFALDLWHLNNSVTAVCNSPLFTNFQGTKRCT